MSGTWKKVLGGGCCLALIITVGILIGVSVSVLDATEVGLDYSDVSKTVDTTQVYPNGRHFLGVGHSFVTYVKEMQRVSFSNKTEPLESRTNDGLRIQLDIDYQYRLKPDSKSLMSLYFGWGAKFNNAYLLISRSVLRDVASEFDAFDFFFERQAIQSKMHAKLSVALEELGGSLVELQLNEVTMPAALYSEVQQTEQRNQEISVRLAALSEAEVVANARRLRIPEEFQAIEQHKLADANVRENAKNAKIDQFLAATQAEIVAYKQMRETLGLSNKSAFRYVINKTLGPGASRNKYWFERKPAEIACFAQPDRCIAGDALVEAEAPFARTVDRADGADRFTVCVHDDECEFAVSGGMLGSSDEAMLVESADPLGDDVTCGKAAAPTLDGADRWHGLRTAALDVEASATGHSKIVRTRDVISAAQQGVASAPLADGKVFAVVCYCIHSLAARGCRDAGDFDRKVAVAVATSLPADSVERVVVDPQPIGRESFADVLDLKAEQFVDLLADRLRDITDHVEIKLDRVIKGGR